MNFCNTFFDLVGFLKKQVTGTLNHPTDNHKGFVNEFSLSLILGYGPESFAGFPLEDLGHDTQGALRSHHFESTTCAWGQVLGVSRKRLEPMKPRDIFLASEKAKPGSVVHQVVQARFTWGQCLPGTKVIQSL